MNKAKHIVILTPGFAADEQDDTCLPAQQAFVVALQSVRPEWKISIISLQYPFRQDVYQWKGINVYAIGGKNRGSLARLFSWGRTWKQLKDLQRKQKIDGILSFWYGECALIGKRFSLDTGCKHICWILGQDARPGNRFVGRARLRPGEIVAMSDFLAGELEKNYDLGPVQVIPNGVSALQPDPAAYRPIDILGAGSLIPLKQYELFVQCIYSLKKNIPNILAVLCGKGPEAYKLFQLIRSLDLQTNILMVDEVPHGEVLQYMQRSRVFLHPSSYEGFSTVCLEARASGASVVSFCRPMKEAIPGWHTVSSVEEMELQCLLLLQEQAPVTACLAFHMDDSADTMARLFV